MIKLLQYIEAIQRTIGTVGFLACLAVLIIFGIVLITSSKCRKYFIFIMWFFFIIASSGAATRYETNLPPWLLALGIILRWPMLLFVIIWGYSFLIIKRDVSKTFYPLLFMGLFSIVGSLLTSTPSETLPRALWFALMITGIPLAGAAAIDESYDPSEIFIIWCKVGSVMMILFMVWTIMFPFSSFQRGYHAFIANANTYGWIAATMLLPVLTCLLEKRGNRIFLLAQTVWWVCTLLLSRSRGNIILGIIVVFAIWTSYLKRVSMWLVMVIIAFVSFYIIGSLLTEVDIKEITYIGMAGRIEIWQMAWELIREKPLFGYGAGWTDTQALLGVFSINIHNGYIALILDLGFVGMAILVPTYIIPVVISRRYQKLSKSIWGTSILRNTRWYLYGMFLWAIVEAWFTGIGSCILPMYLFCLGIILEITRAAQKAILNTDYMIEGYYDYEVQPGENDENLAYSS